MRPAGWVLCLVKQSRQVLILSVLLPWAFSGAISDETGPGGRLACVRESS